MGEKMKKKKKITRGKAKTSRGGSKVKPTTAAILPTLIHFHMCRRDENVNILSFLRCISNILFVFNLAVFCSFNKSFPHVMEIDSLCIRYTRYLCIRLKTNYIHFCFLFIFIYFIFFLRLFCSSRVDLIRKLQSSCVCHEHFELNRGEQDANERNNIEIQWILVDQILQHPDDLKPLPTEVACDEYHTKICAAKAYSLSHFSLFELSIAFGSVLYQCHIQTPTIISYSFFQSHLVAQFFIPCHF